MCFIIIQMGPCSKQTWVRDSKVHGKLKQTYRLTIFFFHFLFKSNKTNNKTSIRSNNWKSSFSKALNRFLTSEILWFHYYLCMSIIFHWSLWYDSQFLAYWYLKVTSMDNSPTFKIIIKIVVSFKYLTFPNIWFHRLSWQ